MAESFLASRRFFPVPLAADGGRVRGTASVIAYHLRLKFRSDEFGDVPRSPRRTRNTLSWFPAVQEAGR